MRALDGTVEEAKTDIAQGLDLLSSVARQMEEAKEATAEEDAREATAEEQEATAEEQEAATEAQEAEEFHDASSSSDLFPSSPSLELSGLDTLN